MRVLSTENFFSRQRKAGKAKRNNGGLERQIDGYLDRKRERKRGLKYMDLPGKKCC